MNPRRPPRQRPWSWRGRTARGVFFQAIALSVVCLAIGLLAHNTVANLRARGIQSGFDFLNATAGFDIGESPIPFSPTDSYARAIGIGVLNTLRVALIGILLTTVFGTLLGIGRLSRNALVRGLCYGYVELFRNVPLLLQLLMWYLLCVEVLPPAQAAWNFAGLFYLSKGGLAFPVPLWHAGQILGLVCALVGVGIAWGWRRREQRRFELTGIPRDRVWVPLLLVATSVGIGWWAGGAPRAWQVPEQLAFAVDGGGSATPEFLALLLGLVLYTAAFVAEVVRSGIQSVDRGQVEAARALGLTPRLEMRLVVLPQALRVIVPPLTNQYLNLTKNSSLAVAIGYPDVVSIANTTLNQTGRAVECIAIIMAVYLATSLATAACMSWYNRRVAIVER
ncbi:MAG: ABC transporter permease subunit [Burkholderiales bacterium]